MAQTLDNNRAALAFARVMQPDETQLAQRKRALQALAQRITTFSD